jgi:transmembrane sensor
MTQKTAHEIDMEAAGWAARLDRGALSEEEETRFQAWIDGDPRRLGAFGRMRALALASEKARALGPHFDAAPMDEPGSVPRRQLLKRGGMIAAGLVLAASAGAALLRPASQRHATAKGETRVVALSDGSVVTLNTQSELAVQFTGTMRKVSLRRGEALFDVAKNAQRPFIVDAGDTQIRVVGTSFLVRRFDAAPVEVLVREGIVEVLRPQMAQSAVRLLANGRAVADHADIATASLAPADLHRALAWKDGLLAFEGQRLAEAAAEFARYSDTRIVIDDEGLAREEIAGLFRATDPIGFARTVAVSLKARIVIGDNEVRLTR